MAESKATGDVAARRAALAEKKEARDKARKEEMDLLVLEAEELEEKLESEGKKRGVDYDVLVTLVGVFAVRNPDFVVAKKFSDTPTEKKTVEDVVTFVAPCVCYPEEAMAARAVFQSHAGVAWKLATLALKLHEADASERLGK